MSYCYYLKPLVISAYVWFASICSTKQVNVASDKPDESCVSRGGSCKSEKWYCGCSIAPLLRETISGWTGREWTACCWACWAPRGFALLSFLLRADSGYARLSRSICIFASLSVLKRNKLYLGQRLRGRRGGRGLAVYSRLCRCRGFGLFLCLLLLVLMLHVCVCGGEHE
jgi:hypothetical protein